MSFPFLTKCSIYEQAWAQLEIQQERYPAARKLFEVTTNCYILFYICHSQWGQSSGGCIFIPGM